MHQAPFVFVSSWSGGHRKHQNGLQFQCGGARRLAEEEDSSGVPVWIGLVSEIPVLTKACWERTTGIRHRMDTIVQIVLFFYCYDLIKAENSFLNVNVGNPS